jgi:ubiquinol-cytochrome c reductase cytochrome c subunit
MMHLMLAALVSGSSLFQLHCASCHGAQLQGTGGGPPLLKKSAADVDFMLRTGRMPAAGATSVQLAGRPAFNEAQIKALVAYVVFTGHGSAALPVVEPGNAARGRALFAQNCEQCHGATASGASVGSDNVAPSLHHTPDLQIAEAARIGPGVMPRFGRDVLSSQDLDDIVAFVGTFRTDANEVGGWSLGNVGPVAEGAIAWLIGLAVLIVFVRSMGTGE